MTLNLKALALSGGRRLWAALKVITRLGYRGVCAGVSVLLWFLAAVDWEDVEVPDVPGTDDSDLGSGLYTGKDFYYGSRGVDGQFYGIWKDVHKTS